MPKVYTKRTRGRPELPKLLDLLRESYSKRSTSPKLQILGGGPQARISFRVGGLLPGAWDPQRSNEKQQDLETLVRDEKLKSFGECLSELKKALSRIEPGGPPGAGIVGRLILNKP